MIHADFVNDPNGRFSTWRLTDWSSAVRIALNRRALFFFRVAFAALLAPTILLAAYSLYSSNLSFLLFVFLSFWGFWTSSPGPTGIGMVASVLVALVGSVCALLLHDSLLMYASVFPGFTWFGSCAILGTTASYLTEALRKSDASFQVLFSRGILIATKIAEPTIAPKRRSGTLKNQ